MCRACHYTYKLVRFSKRLEWRAERNSFSLRLQEKRAAGVPLLDLTVTNPTEALDDYPEHEIAEAYGAVRDLRYEPDALGLAKARAAIVDWYQEKGIRAEAARLALTASTSEAYSILFKLLCDPGDEVLVPRPSYPLFDYLAHAEGVRTKQYDLSYDGAWYLDFPSLRAAIGPRAKAIIVVNPNNPTGSFLKLDELEKLTGLASDHDLALISDEVFMTYAFDSAPATLARTLIGHDRVLSFSLNGLSKGAGMPQMKLGWIAVNGPGPEAAEAIANLEFLLDSYLSVSTPVQMALEELLRIGASIGQRVRLRIERNRQRLTALKNSSIETLASEGGWSSILRLPALRSEEEWIGALLERGVVTQPGYFYDLPGEPFAVVSLLTEEAIFEEGIRRLGLLAGDG